MIKESIDTIFDFISEKNITEEDCYNNQGVYPVFTGQTEDNGIMAHIDGYEIDGECVTFTTYGSAGKVNYRTGQFTIGRNCMGLKPKSEYLDKVNLRWFAYKYQNLFFRTRIGDISGQRSLNKLLLSKIIVELPDITIQNEELECYERVNKLIQDISETRESISGLGRQNIIYDEYVLEEKLGNVFKFHGGNNNFTEDLIYHNQPESFEDSVSILSGATIENNMMGCVSSNTILPDGNRIKIFNEECIIVTRNGYYAGTMNYVTSDNVITINDHAYIMTIKPKYKKKINLIWFINSYQELFYNLVSSRSDNATFNKTYAGNQIIKIPDIILQNEISDRIMLMNKWDDELKKAKYKLEELIEYEIS